MQIYNAIIVAQLTYGLNTLQLTEVCLARLDAFQMRGMRYLTNIDHAYHSGVTNEEVVNKVEIILNKGEDLDITWEEFMRANDMSKVKHFTRASETVMKGRMQC